MPVLLFEKETETRAKVTTVIYQTEGIDEAVLSQGIEVPAYTSPEYSEYKYHVAYVNPTTGEVWWESRLKAVTVLAFKRLLTTQERIAIRQAAKTDPVVEDFLDILSSSEEVELDDPDTVEGVNYMVSVGLFSQERGDTILAGGA